MKRMAECCLNTIVNGINNNVTRQIKRRRMQTWETNIGRSGNNISAGTAQLIAWAYPHSSICMFKLDSKRQLRVK